jgi:hypothetical protein
MLFSKRPLVSGGATAKEVAGEAECAGSLISTHPRF